MVIGPDKNVVTPLGYLGYLGEGRHFQDSFGKHVPDQESGPN